MPVKRRLPPAQLKEDLEPLKIEFGGQYVDQLMITSMLYGEENTTKNYKTNWVWRQLSALTILNWKPMGKRQGSRPRKMWMDVVEEDLERLRVQEWREVVQDREKWRDIVMAAKTLREY
ncbi:hypothetical protein QTP88_029740 [Uroleucon formosanum]